MARFYIHCLRFVLGPLEVTDLESVKAANFFWIEVVPGMFQQKQRLRTCSHLLD